MLLVTRSLALFSCFLLAGSVMISQGLTCFIYQLLNKALENEHSSYLKAIHFIVFVKKTFFVFKIYGVLLVAKISNIRI